MNSFSGRDEDRVDDEGRHDCYKKIKVNNSGVRKLKTPCGDCKFKHKQELKLRQQEIRRRNYERYEKIQDELLGSSRNPTQFGQDTKQKAIKAFREMEAEVQKKAYKEAKEFMLRSPPLSKCTSDSVTAANSPSQPLLKPTVDIDYIPIEEEVTQPEEPVNDGLVTLYKVLLLPEEVLSMYVRSQTESILAKEFRTMAMLVHPDKNSHPKAREAFHKLRKHWIERAK